MFVFTVSVAVVMFLSCGVLLRAAFVWVDRERASMREERAVWGDERRELLLRIQAPLEAVTQQVLGEGLPCPPAIGLDDDEAFWDAQMSKEQLASFVFEQEKVGAA